MTLGRINTWYSELQPSQKMASLGGVAFAMSTVIGFGLRSLPAAVVVFLGILALFGAWSYLERRLRGAAQKRESNFLRKMTEGGDDTVRELRENWSRAIEEFRGTGRSRDDFGYYMLIGEPGSGKTTTLRKSGLSFPIGDAKIKGISGTKDCDWWFTENNILLDTAGRLAFNQEDVVDQQSWRTFLRLLRDYRPQCPINGVIVAIPCNKLLRDTFDEHERKADVIRAALVELQHGLEVQFPVYVLLTKADYIRGFGSYFAHLRAIGQLQLLGWSRPNDRIKAPFAAGELDEAFELVTGGLRRHRLALLENEVEYGRQVEFDDVYVFPEELASLRAALQVYLSRMFPETKLADPTFFRGFYLTSGQNEGISVTQASAALFGAGLTENDAPVALQDRALFIRDFYTKKLFEEPGLVRPTSKREQRIRLLNRIGYAVVTLLSAIGLTAAFSGWRNVETVQHATAIVGTWDPKANNGEISNDAQFKTVAEGLGQLAGTGALPADDKDLIAVFQRGEALGMAGLISPGGQEEVARKLATAYRVQLQALCRYALKDVFAVEDRAQPARFARLRQGWIAAAAWGCLRDNNKDHSIEAMELVLEYANMGTPETAARPDLRPGLAAWKQLFDAYKDSSGYAVEPLNLDKVFVGVAWSTLAQDLKPRWSSLYAGDRAVDWPKSTPDLEMVWAVQRGMFLEQALTDMEAKQVGHPETGSTEWRTWYSSWTRTRQDLLDRITEARTLMNTLGDANLDDVMKRLRQDPPPHHLGTWGSRKMDQELDQEWGQLLSRVGNPKEMVEELWQRVQGREPLRVLGDLPGIAPQLAGEIAERDFDPAAVLTGDPYTQFRWTLGYLGAPDGLAMRQAGSGAGNGSGPNAGVGAAEAAFDPASGSARKEAAAIGGALAQITEVARRAFRMVLFQEIEESGTWAALCNLSTNWDDKAGNWLMTLARAQQLQVRHPIKGDSLKLLCTPGVLVIYLDRVRSLVDMTNGSRNGGLGEEDGSRHGISAKGVDAIRNSLRGLRDYYQHDYCDTITKVPSPFQQLETQRVKTFLELYRDAVKLYEEERAKEEGQGRGQTIEPVAIPTEIVAEESLKSRLLAWKALNAPAGGDWVGSICAVKDRSHFVSADSIFVGPIGVTGGVVDPVVRALQTLNTQLNEEILMNSRDSIVDAWGTSIASGDGYRWLCNLTQGKADGPGLAAVMDLYKGASTFREKVLPALSYLCEEPTQGAKQLLGLRQMLACFGGLDRHLRFLLNANAWRIWRVRAWLDYGVANQELNLRLASKSSPKWIPPEPGDNRITKSTRDLMKNDAGIRITADGSELFLMCRTPDRALLEMESGDPAVTKISESDKPEGYCQRKYSGEFAMLRLIATHGQDRETATPEHEARVKMGNFRLALAFFDESGSTPVPLGPFPMTPWSDPKGEKK